MPDLRPATARVIDLLDGVGEQHLSAPTPMGPDVTGLLHHLTGLALAFRDAAGKVQGPTTGTPPAPVARPLPDGWRADLVGRLEELGRAWGEPSAWTGMTRAGGVDLPGEVCGLVALDEVLLHGWDLAAATGQPYAPSDAEAEAVLPIVTPPDDPERAAAERRGMFGPALPVPEGASAFERVLALAGRDPAWAPPAR
ncbi:TIGR03086 family metal-binding protein [Arthrobacter sp. NEB 688]|uniref:TIGR03086 family metal-binding protein n=1 Tax=Arthrobacter sp. NEB 688 TaxID=904039 RepID=UPI0015637905|nr:TIGR03086 family metal-binding protein [Arthrobacter sp. NEB 688]QKE85009.1 TIGR03086 family protein [Arthrobacter sp. NEB 688]